MLSLLQLAFIASIAGKTELLLRPTTTRSYRGFLLLFPAESGKKFWFWQNRKH